MHAISSVLGRILLVNINEQKYHNYLGGFFCLSLVLSVRYIGWFFLPVSGVIGKVHWVVFFACLWCYR